MFSNGADASAELPFMYNRTSFSRSDFVYRFLVRVGMGGYLSTQNIFPNKSTCQVENQSREALIHVMVTNEKWGWSQMFELTTQDHPVHSVLVVRFFDMAAFKTPTYTSCLFGYLSTSYLHSASSPPGVAYWIDW